MTALQVKSAEITNGKAALRPALKLLQANYSERKNITADRWRLLAVAFAGVDDDTLNAAAIEHMKESPAFFPNVGDLWKHISKFDFVPRAQTVCANSLDIEAAVAMHNKAMANIRLMIESWQMCNACRERSPYDDCPFCADLRLMTQETKAQ